MKDQAVSSLYIEKRLNTLCETLKKKGFGAQFAPDKATAKQMFLDQIPEGASVFFTGSQTLEQIGVKPYLLESGNVKVEFEDPLFPITPGQGAVFYDGDEILGGGIISKDVNI